MFASLFSPTEWNAVLLYGMWRVCFAFDVQVFVIMNNIKKTTDGEYPRAAASMNHICVCYVWKAAAANTGTTHAPPAAGFSVLPRSER